MKKTIRKKEKDPAFWKLRQGSSILLRTAMLAWLASIASVFIFAFHVIPQQKQVFLDVLDSNARVLSSSIHDIAAASIVTEDYSEVIDHSMGIIKDNPSIGFLVFSRNDGFSLVNTAEGWSTETLDNFWNKGFGNDKPMGSIRSSSLVSEEVYHYSVPFDYSGVNWGWAHIGLSLDQYHAGITSMYKRTAYAGLLCVIVGLLASLLYASRLVRPLLMLEAAVHRVAQGDLDARAEILSGDEVGKLAHAFNRMTQSIQDRDAFVHSHNRQLAALAGEQSLHNGDIMEYAKQICEASADMLGVERVGVWLFNEDQTVLECLSQFSRASRTHTQKGSLDRKGNEGYFDALEKLRVMAIDDVSEAPQTACLLEDYLRPLNVASMLDSAIRIAGDVVGVVCHEHIGEPRPWTAEEENFAGSISDLMALALEARDRRASRDELLVAKEAAEAASEAKSQFLANMSHEIRTPLNGVVGMLKLLRESPLDNKQKNFVGKGILSSEALLSVINDILDFSKIEAGKFELEKIPFDLVDITENVVQMFAQQAEEKGLELACLIQRNVPAAVCGDGNRIGQVLINLVGNAIKFTEHGDVIVSARLESEDDETVAVRFEIKDTGIGISLEDKSRIFEAFRQEDNSTTRRFGGTGLGLGICRQLVELMGGEIQVESHPGRGSTFSFTIGLDKYHAPSSAPRRLNGIRGLHALVVDDHSINREILCYELETWGCRPTEAEDGAAALKIMRERATEGRPFDLAIIDWNMPEIDGEELGRQIKADPQIANTTMVMLSSATEMNTARLREVGFSAYLAKPARQSELYDAIVNSINNIPSPERERESPPPRPVNRAEIRILLAEDNEINQEVASEILKASGYSCDIVGHGREAVAAVESKEYDLVFMDCMMPEMDGYEATRCIRESEKGSNRHLPIVALTANAMKGDREHCLESGMDDYLSKPLDPALTADMVKKWHMKKIITEKPALQPEAPSGKDDSDQILFNRETLLNRCMGNESLVDKLITKFLEQKDVDLRCLGEALSSADIEQVVHFSHRLKGASANLSMESLRKIAGEIEGHAREGDLGEASTGFRNLSAEIIRVQRYLKAV
ncbi:MAG: response regulator [Verrucomicrobiota bacterium]